MCLLVTGVVDSLNIAVRFWSFFRVVTCLRIQISDVPLPFVSGSLLLAQTDTEGG